MDIPAYLALKSAMASLKVLDDSVVEIVKLLLERIENLEAKVDGLQGRTDDE